jgi:hypothetical protein
MRRLESSGVARIAPSHQLQPAIFLLFNVAQSFEFTIRNIPSIFYVVRTLCAKNTQGTIRLSSTFNISSNLHRILLFHNSCA